MLASKLLVSITVYSLVAAKATTSLILTRRAEPVASDPEMIHVSDINKLYTLGSESPSPDLPTEISLEKYYEDSHSEDFTYESNFENSIPEQYTILMDEPIPSSEELFLKAPILPGTKKPQTEMVESDVVNDISLDEASTLSARKMGSAEAGNSNLIELRFSKVKEYKTASGVTLRFVDFSDSTTRTTPTNHEEAGNSSEPEQQELSKTLIFGRFSDAAKRTFKWMSDWFKTKILRKPESDRLLAESYRQNAESIPENYNNDFIDDNAFYDVSVSYSPMARKMESPSKFSRTGGDSFFVSQVYKNGEMAIGITEGIDDLQRRGQDSSEFSRELCHKMSSVFMNEKTRPEMTPCSLLKEALEGIKVNNKVNEGSATALVAVFTPHRTVQIGNLGVSQAMLIRSGALRYMTSTSVNDNGFPRRLTKAFRIHSKMKYFLSDSMEDGVNVEWELEQNDYLILASDGVTRNLSPEQIELLVKEYKAHHVGEVTSSILRKALFERTQEARSSKELDTRYGGFLDDITLIVVKIK
ncbi:hypothetical protein HF325_004943 [Metschnikowia pulcherrima]|uniref:Protein phosphatase n=1 Tax=Metschnikowia pulcherrima TaxID=27326 RepID=A0A8H7LAG2_9ASCO|nr:hypothetical protein HF325_004943 [Metschnikowia pulcherrima]